MRQKVLSILALLLMAVTGAWADDTYTVQFKANGNTKTVENVVLPHQFRCNFDDENGELDQIIKELYGLSKGYCCWEDISSSGNENVTCGSSNGEDYITISAPFEGTATVTGWYNPYSTAIQYSLEISIPGYVAPTVNVTGVSLSETTASMTVGGDALTLTATVAPATATDQTVTWTTSDASVATVADGVVTAVATGTATITATATNGTPDDTSDDFSATCTVTVTDPATKYDLTKADDSEAHGTVAFTVGGNAATQAKKDDVVTVSVTPNEGYSAKDVTVRAYTSWEAANARRRSAPALVSDINVTKQENGTWQFTMPEANVWVVVTYAKNLQDAWIQDIAVQTYTGSAIEPIVTVMDGETALVLNTDYTVAYTDNTEVGWATVTVTGMGNYSGTATTTFFIQANKTDLNDAITEAETYYNSISESNPDAAAALQTAINAAKGVQANPGATQGAVEEAVAALTYALNAAKDAVLTETKTALNDDITEAEAYYNSIKDSNPTAAATLLEAINAAKALKDNTDATQAEVEAAIAALSTAINTAKVEVSRITLTIPAKSYMARIDADKRQIETAVDGVKLYSVQNVTNTEVVLTSELSVIAAEMPYFIYNDNDTEVEVSIIVSSEEADNVDYDSEHFKGTLVDKTFTDEDMEEADHYVLNGGSSFVWVKDAGTLAAGKCWIQLEKSPANARSLSIVFEEGTTTGINAVNTAAGTEDAAVYDLQGRRVMEPTKKGLYIVNGKKVVMK